MKKLLSLVVGILFVSLVVTSCTDDTEENETFLEQQQATDKDDHTNPNNDGGSKVDPDED